MLRTASGRGYRLIGNWSAKADRVWDNFTGLDTEPAVPRPSADNLPFVGSDLIGRTTALHVLCDLLSAYRVVTLTGPGGIGKTRLAIEVARRLLPNFNGAACLIELALLSDRTLVPSIVASELGLDLAGAENTAASVARVIGERKLLLVLDNCEHLIDDAASLAQTIVRMCPNTGVLVTSREILRIEGEYAYRVPPLDAPSVDRATLDATEHSAVELFITAVKARNFDFSPNREGLEMIGTICRRLDGIPLAIELAAARVATLGIELVFTRLDDRFSLLTAGRRTAVPRHRTLRATLDWSYELLPEPESHLLRSLAVFSGGFTLDAAIAVAGGRDKPASNTLDELANLVAKSLVAIDAATVPGRWRMLETTRAYVLGKLEQSGELPSTARRHAMYFRDLFTSNVDSPDARPATVQPSQHVREIANIRTALDWAFSPRGDTAIGVALTAGAIPIWMQLSLLPECRQQVERALVSLPPGDRLSVRTKMELYKALGVSLLLTTGLGREIEIALKQFVELAKDQGDVSHQLASLWSMWTYRANNGENRDAQTIAEQFQQLAAYSENPVDLIVGERLMGATMHYRGQQATARRSLEHVISAPIITFDPAHALRYHHDQRVLATSSLAGFCGCLGSPPRQNNMPRPA